MYSPEQKKLVRLAATSRRVQEENARTSGVDRQVNEVRENSIHLDGHNRMRAPLPLSSSGEPPSNSDAAPAGFVKSEANSALSDAKAHTNDKLDNYYTKGQADDRFASDNHSHSHSHEIGSALSGAYRHSHSISSTTFIKLTRDERLSMLEDRADLEALIGSGTLRKREGVVARNVLNLLTLLQDYRGLNAFERELRFSDPAWAEWTTQYKEVYGVDEYAEADRENFLDYGNVRMDPYEGIAHVGPEKT